jgi:DNA polymerase I
MFALLDGTVFNPRSPKQLKAIFNQFNVPLPKVRRPNGTMSETTDANTLQALFEEFRALTHAPVAPRTVDPEKVTNFLQALLAYRKAAKTNGTYVRGLRKMVWKGRVFPTVMIHSTVSGRTSQKRPSLQVIPHADEIKQQFVVSKDSNVLIEADYKQIELRVLTWLAQEEYFREVFADPSRDLFSELVPVVRPDRSRRTNMHPKDRRNIVKAFVYGLAYGREAKSVAEEFGLPIADAQQMYRDFFNVIPKIVDFRSKVKQQALHQDDLVTPFGRHRRFSLITNENRKEVENEALSFYPQSIASDICIQAFDRLRPALKGKAYCRNLVHDALFWECPEVDLEYVAGTVSSYMKQSAYDIMGNYVRIDIDLEVGRNWGQMIHLEKWLEGERPYTTTVCLKDAWVDPPGTSGRR